MLNSLRKACEDCKCVGCSLLPTILQLCFSCIIQQCKLLFDHCHCMPTWKEIVLARKLQKPLIEKDHTMDMRKEQTICLRAWLKLKKVFLSIKLICKKGDALHLKTHHLSFFETNPSYS